MNSVSSARQSLATVESFLDEITKTAEAHTETGSIGGPTTHPVKNVDDRTETAREGARSAENTKDVKADEGKPSVDSTPVATAKKADEWVQTGNSGDGGTAKDDQIQIGTKKGPTGTDVPVAKAGKNDPGSSHPARTDNNALNGGKYAAADLNNDPLEKLAEELAYLGNTLCADIMVEVENIKAAAAGTSAPAATSTAPQTKQAEIDPNLARQAGWEMASLIGGNMNKQAADTMVHQTLAATIKEAEDAAERTATFLNNFYAAKQADGEDAGAPPSGPGGMGGGDPSAGGPPPSDPSAGGDPSGGDPEAELAQLQQICAQLGTTLPELIQTLESSAGGAGGAPGAGGPPSPAGGPPPAAGGMPPADPSAGGPPSPGGAPGGMQVTAGDAFEYAKMANYIREVVSRSRAKVAAAGK